MDVKSLDVGVALVPARVSKARRGKRRWIGLEVASSIRSREACTEALATLEEGGPTVRLYDFVPGDEVSPGRAIIVVRLQHAPAVRAQLQGAFGLDAGLVALTTSGKIRLVRERLGLERPPRPRRRR